ncbi:MAG: hypothetical protein ACLGH3_02600, partial [Actinomycetota bacterium]
MATLIVLMTVVYGSLRRTPVFVAQCEVLFQGVSYDPSNKDNQDVEPFGSIETNMDIISGPQVAQLTADKLKLPIFEVAGKVNVSLKEGTQIFLLQVADSASATDIDPASRSAELCNAFGESYIQYRRDEARDVFKQTLLRIENDQLSTQEQIEEASEELREAQKTGDGTIITPKLNTFNNLVLMKGELDRRHTAIASQLRFGIYGAGKMNRYAGPGVAVGADLQRSIMLGLIVGLMFGVGIALIREYMDDTVKDKESTQRELGLPVLANLPAAGDLEGLDGPPAATIEAARTLRATLSSLGFPHDKRMLMVASSLSKRRSTTIAALAGAVAESGRSVLVIGSDLRSGRTHESFGIANTVGLANVVRGQVPLQKAIRPAPGLEGVFVLPCGPIIGSPGEILSSESMAFVLREAREWADVVLLDAPPVLAAADASILGAYADGVIMVVSAGRTNRAKAHEAKEQLVAAGARVMGAVLIGGDDERDRDGLDEFDDLGGMPMSNGYAAYGQSAMSGGQGGDWYGDDVITMTARTAPRSASQRRAPAKKVSAAGVQTRPTRQSETSVPRSARTTTSQRATAGRSTAPKRKPAAKKTTTTRKPAARKPAARKPAAKKATATRKPAAKKVTATRKPAGKKTTTARKSAASKPAARKATTSRKPA